MEVKITVHYDKEDVDCCEDYCSLTIEVDGEEILEYGDYYHDKGDEKAEGFKDCLNFLRSKGILKDVIIKEESLADYEWS